MAQRVTLLVTLKSWAQRLKTETIALYLASRDPRTPWYAKAVAFFVVAHTFSPIDLIPDFIPVLGYLDDLIITPLGLWLALRMIPPEVMQEARLKAAGVVPSAAFGRIGIVLVVLVWIILLAAVVLLIYNRWFSAG